MNKTKQKNRKRSVILAFFSFVGTKIRTAISNSAIGRFFSSYDEFNSLYEKGVASTAAKKLASSLRLSKVQNKAARAFDNSWIRQKVLIATSKMRHLTVRFWGVLMLTFSLYVAMMYLIRNFGMFYTAPVSYLVVAAVLGVISLPLLFEKEKTLGKCLLESRFFSWLLFDFFELRYEDFRDRQKPCDKISVAFILGMLFGCCTFFISPLFILACAAALLYCYSAFVSPESALLMILFSLPFLSAFSHPTLVLCMLVLCVLLGYIFKLIRKKRVMRFGILELTVLLFILCIFFGAMKNASMTQSTEGFVMVLLACGFFLTGNLLRTKEMIKHAARALAFSGVICAGFGILEYLLGMSRLDWLDVEMFDGIKGRAVSFFENPNVLGTYLCFVTPLTLSVMSFSKEAKKSRWFIGFCTVLACAVLTWSRGAWLGIIVSVLMLLATTRHFLVTVFSLLLCLPFASYVIPSAVTSRLLSIGNLSDSSSLYRLNIWRGCLDMAEQYGMGGIGMGEGAFSRIYPAFAVSGADTAYHSHSLWLQIMISLGACGLIIFAFMMFFFAQRAFTALKNSSERDISILTAACFSGVVGVLVCGLFDYSWYNYRVYFLFFAVMGLACTCDRVSFRAEGGIYE